MALAEMAITMPNSISVRNSCLTIERVATCALPRLLPRRYPAAFFDLAKRS